MMRRVSFGVFSGGGLHLPAQAVISAFTYRFQGVIRDLVLPGNRPEISPESG
jgi:hypothetical protein